MDKKGINIIINLLTLDQIKQLTEQHNASVIEWVEFDAEDESTWPEENSLCITEELLPNNYSMEYTVSHFYDDSETSNYELEFMYANTKKVIKWAYLSTPKENQNDD